jgi:hypothetical protein
MGESRASIQGLGLSMRLIPANGTIDVLFSQKVVIVAQLQEHMTMVVSHPGRIRRARPDLLPRQITKYQLRV